MIAFVDRKEIMRGSRAFGLVAAVVLGVMAFGATGAQAASLNVITEPETSIPGIFLINAGTQRPTGLTQETVAASGPGGRLVIPTKSSEIDCAKGGLTGSSFVENEYENFLKSAGTMKPGGHGTGQVTFEECKVFATNAKGEKGAELASCSETLNGKSHTITANFSLRAVRHQEGVSEKNRTYLILEPLIASKANAEANIALTSKFTTFTFSGTCALPSSVNLTGALVIEAPATDAIKPKLSVKSWKTGATKAELSDEQSLLGAKLSFGASEAFIEANEIEAKLAGTGASLSWGATAELELRSRHLAILLNGAYLAENLVKLLTGQQTSATGVLSIPAKRTELTCGKGQITEATVKNEKDTEKNPEGNVLTEGSESGLSAIAEVSVEFGECRVNSFVLNEEGKKEELIESKPCTKAFNEHNKNAKGEAGHPLARMLVLAFLHLHKIVGNGGLLKEQYLLIVRITQPAGTPFATMEFGGTCSLPAKVEVTGSVSGEVLLPWNADVKEFPVTFESEAAIGKELNGISETKLKYGANEAFIEGKYRAELPGVTAWGVM